MSEKSEFLAIDLGAESGRGIIATLADGKIELEEIRRWPNRPVSLGGTLYWDFPFLFAEIIESMKICAQRSAAIKSMSVDTWAVDFGLLSADGYLLGNPVHYRDSRTASIHDYSNPIMPVEEIFTATGYEPWPLASLFQLLAMQRDKSPILPLAKTFLNMPDLFHYFLTGIAKSEMSVANTTNLMGVDCEWSQEIISKFSLADMFASLVKPATVLGNISDAVAKQTQLASLPVIATCGHDTSAAVAAAPATGDNWAYLSCGTWSVLGKMLPEPITNLRCLEMGWTNEYTVGGWYLGKNILGLWLVQELKRKWDTRDESWDYNKITALARNATSTALFDVQDSSLLAPVDMEDAINRLIASTGQKIPASRGELVRCILESLALQYATSLDEIAILTGNKPAEICMVGGGIRNEFLCQLTANACDKPVRAGADQCTAMGNALTQALGMGIIKDASEIRQIMRNSTTSKLYLPRDQKIWQDKKTLYAKIVTH